MSKYGPLNLYLKKLNLKHISLSFSDIIEIIHEDLPKSAYKYKVWWSNDKSRIHPQANSWIDAGCFVTKINIDSQLVVFERKI